MIAILSRQQLRRSVPSVALALLLLTAAIAFRAPLVAWFSGEPRESSSAGTSDAPAGAQQGAATAAEEPDAIHHYTCSMHPSVHQQGPGKCPICGMDLSPVSNAQQEQGVVLIDEARRQLIGVRLGTVSVAPLQRTLRAVGRVTYDESKLTDVTLKVHGWITKLLVGQTGQRVKAGQTLFLLYSPEIFSAQQDFLLARQGATQTASAGAAAPSSELLVRSTRQRLRLLGLGDSQIDDLARQGVPSESIPFPAPASGFVIEKNVVEGAAVEAGMRLYRIAALTSVWVEAEVYEADLPQVRTGQHVSVTLDYVPGRTYAGKVSQIFPFLDPSARTGRVRVELANPELELRPGMYASVQLASKPEPRLQVPASAVVYTGPRRLVFVDLGEGRFRPQEIRVGAEAGGMYEVLEGLSAGDRVATSGVFLIAAEARISTATKYWESPAEEPAPHAQPAEPPAPSSADARSQPAAPSTSGATSGATSRAKSVSPPSSADALYSCPMHPEIESRAPGKCPKCGMDLVQKSKDGSQ